MKEDNRSCIGSVNCSKPITSSTISPTFWRSRGSKLEMKLPGFDMSHSVWLHGQYMNPEPNEYMNLGFDMLHSVWLHVCARLVWARNSDAKALTLRALTCV